MRQGVINLVPQDWRKRQERSPRRSLILTGGLLLLLLAISLRFPGERRVAEAAPPERAPASPQRPSPRENVPVSDPAALSAWRAAGWLPWDRLLGQIPSLLGDRARIETLRYWREQNVLEISGEIEEISLLPVLMLRLEEYPWLMTPDPKLVERDPTSGRTRFTIRLQVEPLLTVQEER